MFLTRNNNHFSEEHYTVSLRNGDVMCNEISKLSKQYSIQIYVQQDATLHSLFCLETARHVSGGTTTQHQEHKQPYLQHLVFLTPLLLLWVVYTQTSSNSSMIAADSSNGVTNTRCCG
jgi:ABC-type Na+ efflux pump permease subunit